MREKNIRVALIVIIAVFACEGIIIVVSSYFASRNKEWGIELSVKEVTSTGLALTAQRSKSEISGRLYVDTGYRIERWTLFGWKYIGPTGSHIDTADLNGEMEEGDSVTRYIRWENSYGRLRPGIYRIGEYVITSTPGSDGAEVRENFKLYATFPVFF